MAPSMYMDEQTMWIERLDDRALFRLNDIMCEESMRQGYYPGKTETKWWRLYVAIVEECQLRNKAKGW